MCLAIPGKILETWTENSAPFARVDFNGEEKRVSLDLIERTATVFRAILIYLPLVRHARRTPRSCHPVRGLPPTRPPWRS